MTETPAANQSRLVRVFSALERWGQRLPDPLTLFVIMAGLVLLCSAIFSGISAEVVQRSGDGNLVSILSSNLAAERNMSYYENLERSIAELTVEEVNAAVRKYFNPKNLVVVTAGDLAK